MERVTRTEIFPHEMLDGSHPGNYERTAAAFVRDVFGRDPSEFGFASDSELNDLYYYGIPEKEFESMSHAGGEPVCWDDWMIEKLFRCYGVQLTSTRIYMTELFRQIEAQRGKRPRLH